MKTFFKKKMDEQLPAEVIFEWYEGEDSEKNLFLRNLRDKIGYGPGWTFKQAVWEMVHPYLLLIIMTLIFVWIVSHLRIDISWIP